MKLIRFGELGKEKPAVLIGENRFDVSEFIRDYDEQFFDEDGLSILKKIIVEKKESLKIVTENIRLGSPVARPSKIICIGLNYIDHAKETNAAIPEEPILFFKSTTALCGPFDDVIIPKNSTKTDWEV
ncbi:MAG TPA: fumarylacetoacetate hydrolase family protein, partial [Ferruginibacter sp.]|nr:fumarylacetoacetate hydrolase family protein [Ferruginibacter sp.]